MKTSIKFILSIVVFLISTLSCSKGEEPIDLYNYSFEIKCLDIEWSNLDFSYYFDYDFTCSDDGKTYNFSLNFINNEDGQYANIPGVKYTISSNESWADVSQSSGDKLVLKVDKNQGLSTREATVEISIMYNSELHSTYRIEIKQESHKPLLELHYIIAGYVNTTDKNGWNIDCEGGNSSCIIAVRDYEKEELNINIDATWASVYKKELLKSESDNNGRKYDIWEYTIAVEFSKLPDDRSCNVTISNNAGETISKVITQKKYTSMNAFFNSFNYNGIEYRGWDLNSSSGSVACAAWIDTYDSDVITGTISGGSWAFFSGVEKVISQEYDSFRNEYYDRWRFDIGVRENTGTDRKCEVIFSKANGEKIGPATIVQKGKSSGGNTGGSTTGDDTKGYTITRTSVCSIYVLDNKSTGTKYTKNYYKWVSSTNRVILSSSSTNSTYWIGVASKNYDSSRAGYSVSSYSYKYVDYSPVGGAWYYYFN